MGTRLAGKVALITGAGSGIGAASAALFAAEGAAVGCADMNLAGAREVAERITAAGGRAIAIAADVADPTSAEQMVGDVVAAFGRLDVLYANAGIPGSGSAGDTSFDDWNRVIAVNLTGVWLSAKYSLVPMLDQGSGSIVNQASVGGLIGVPGIASYAAAKAGVIGLTRQMAADYAPRGIRVNAICPGTVPTPLVRTTYENRGGFATGTDGPVDVDALLDAARVRFPMGRLGTTADIAHAALYLASDESGWVTGVALPVDGGMTTV